MSPFSGLTTTSGATFPSLYNKWVGLFVFPANQYREDARNGAYLFSAISKRTRMSNHLQKSIQRKHILISYFKNLF